jgi:hypothetical protein
MPCVSPNFYPGKISREAISPEQGNESLPRSSLQTWLLERTRREKGEPLPETQNALKLLCLCLAHPNLPLD